MDFKYVHHTGVGFVIWPRSDNLWHADVGHALKRRAEDGQLVSAGFARIVDGKVTCYGRSESLSLGGRPGDSAALAQQLGLTA